MTMLEQYKVYIKWQRSK